MNRLFYPLFFSLTLLTSFISKAETPAEFLPVVPNAEVQDAFEKSQVVAQLGPKYQEYIPFAFERKPLLDIVNTVVASRGANIILPQRPAELDALRKQLVTYQPETSPRVTVNEAWRLTELFLDALGFSIIKKKDKLYTIVKNGGQQPNEQSVGREPLPLYIATPADKLPRGDERIRYIYYLRNLRVPQNPNEATTNELTEIFKQMLSPSALVGPGNIPVIYEPKTNGFIIVDKANNISSVMRIIAELDATGFKEVVEVLPLYNIPAQDVKAVFENLRRAAGDADRTSPFIRQDPRADSISYFAADTKILADPRTNSLILMGRESAVSRISEFIQEYVDTPAESAGSILHYYDLQYLDAKNFADVLQKIVAAQAPSQSVGAPSGAERFFQGVTVFAEAREPLRTIDSQLTELKLEGVDYNVGISKDNIYQTGGNRIIVAALASDWERVRGLIEQLDKPQPQVILEVLIVDLTDTENFSLGATSRNPTNTTNATGPQFLSSNLSPVNAVLNFQTATTNGVTNFTTGVPPNPALAQDLLGYFNNNINGQGTGDPDLISLINGTTQGSTLISFNDPATPGIALILQVLQNHTTSKVLSHPYLVTTNNQKATIANQQLLRGTGAVVPIQAGGVETRVVDIPAVIQVQMWPHISSSDRLNLQVAVDVNQFIDPVNFTRITRRVNTDANISSGEILVIGGLTQIIENDSTFETPFLSKIPIIGYLFKRNTKILTKSNLAIFIAPTIVQAKLRGGLNVYTADKIRKSRRDASDSVIFDTLRDPITRIYFTDDAPKNEIVREYLKHASNAPEFETLKTTRELRREKSRPLVAPPQPAQQLLPIPRRTNVKEILG
ncbi:hypothetical protein H0X48_06740 [Candidatus Dependentiae bacterium]|nr:hypothetical protein [Candidatus Dependentiae bacterium]